MVYCNPLISKNRGLFGYEGLVLRPPKRTISGGPKMKNILLLVVMACFVNIIDGTIFAEEKEEIGLKVDDLLRDPFVCIIDIDKIRYQPDKGPSVRMPLFPMVLRGLMVQEGNSVAIINEEIVTEGQTWHDLEVVRIDDAGVTLSYRGEDLRLVMKEESGADTQ